MTNEFEDIIRLTQRFMDGLTTVEEERRLADYYRTHDVPQEYEEYKVMFAWFDEDMARTQAPTRKPATAKLRRLWTAVAAAVAVVALMLVVWPTNHTDLPAPAPMATAATTQHADSTATVEADTVVTMPERSAPTLRRRAPRRHRYTPAPPKTYMAHDIAQTETAPADSTDEIDRIIMRKLRDIDAVQEAMLRDAETINRMKELEIAVLDEYDETNEQIVY